MHKTIKPIMIFVNDISSSFGRLIIYKNNNTSIVSFIKNRQQWLKKHTTQGLVGGGFTKSKIIIHK